MNVALKNTDKSNLDNYFMQQMLSASEWICRKKMNIKSTEMIVLYVIETGLLFWWKNGHNVPQ